MESLSARLGRNVRALREARGLTQAQLAKMAEIPRATWASLETGSANPTLMVLSRAALALSVSTEELLSQTRGLASHYPADVLPVKQRGQALVRKLLPDPLPGTEIDRFELPINARMVGIPHMPGTREYLACEQGTIGLTVSGDSYVLEVGDVVAFRGDQRHSYANVGTRKAIAYSVVLFASGA